MSCSDAIVGLIMLGLFFWLVFSGEEEMEDRKFDELQRRRIAKREQRRKEWREQEKKYF